MWHCNAPGEQHGVVVAESPHDKAAAVEPPTEATSCEAPPRPVQHVAIYGIVQPVTLQTRPEGCTVIVEQSRNRLGITLPPKLGAGPACRAMFFILLLFVGVPVGLMIAGTVMTITQGFGFWLWTIPVPVMLLCCCITRIPLLKLLLGSRLQESLVIDRQQFCLDRRLDASIFLMLAMLYCRRRRRTVEGSSQQLAGARVVPVIIGQPENELLESRIELVSTTHVLTDGAERAAPPAIPTVHRFGVTLPLIEQQWLVSVINAHIEELTGRQVDYACMPAAREPRIITPSSDGGG